MTYPKEYRQSLIARYKAGESYKSIAVSLNRSSSAVLNNLVAWGARVQHPNSLVPEKTRKEIVARYDAGESVKSIATSLQRHDSTVIHNLINWGAKMRGHIRTYRLDENFFDNINSQGKAYWLGFLFADGAVVAPRGGRPRSVMVKLQDRDRGHLEKLLESLDSDIPIKTHLYAGRYYSSVTISSTKLCCSLVSHGCIPRKTCNHGCPSLRDDLYQHFFRGYFDGDGSLYKYKLRGVWGFNAVGAPAFMPVMHRWLVDHAGVNCTKTRMRGRAMEIGWQGGRQVELLCRLLYKNATIYLDRKYDLYCRLLRRRTKCGRVTKKELALAAISDN